jgi:DNA-binding LytR/AlgR family response regulator
MNVLIIEDEQYTANRLRQLVLEYDKDITIAAIINSVSSAIEWFKTHQPPDLILQDIQLSDGTCFDIYKAVPVNSPVIFTTAYNEYALKSFEVNSIDYLVKPYDFNDIKRVLEKFRNFSSMFQTTKIDDLNMLGETKRVLPRIRFLVKIGDNFKVIQTSEIAYFLSDGGLSFACLFDGKKYPLDQSLSEISFELDENNFFRINRNCIVSSKSIQKISSWYNSRLQIELLPKSEVEIIVSRERVREFKTWLGGG